MLGLLGGYGLLLLQGRELLRDLRESTTVVIELRPETGTVARGVFADYLAEQPYVKPGSLLYLSREDGARRLREEFGEAFLDFDLDNPLYEVYTFNVPEAFFEAAAVARLREEVESQPAVLACYVQEDIVRALTQRIGALKTAGLVLAAVLLVGVVFLVTNMTRLALQAQAPIIKNMELVGASWGFISRPFVRESAALGLLGGGLAVAMTLGLGAFAKTSLPGAWRTVSDGAYVALAGGLLLAGVLLHGFATFYVLRRTLRFRDGDLVPL